jgi:hypothetical protein
MSDMHITSHNHLLCESTNGDAEMEQNNIYIYIYSPRSESETQSDAELAIITFSQSLYSRRYILTCMHANTQTHKHTHTHTHTDVPDACYAHS